MTPLVLDRQTLAKLDEVKDRVAICDESGRMLGYFQPLVDRAAYADVVIPFSNEELNRFEQEPGERKLSEILSDLGKQSCLGASREAL